MTTPNGIPSQTAATPPSSPWPHASNSSCLCRCQGPNAFFVSGVTFVSTLTFVIIVIHFEKLISFLKKIICKKRRDDPVLPRQNDGHAPPAQNQVRVPLGRSVTLQSHITSPKRKFTYQELVRAIGGFSNATLLGNGYLGHVYKGVLPNGMEIAVREIRRGIGDDGREFQAKLDTVIGIQCHEHVVSFLGYCVSDGERLLVYEFVRNKSLEFHLHGRNVPTMDWPTRMKIALGVAKGLAYLHEDCHPKIIHGDIKASNILLDHNFNAKVADVGLAKLSVDNVDYARSFPMLPYGCVAPEYMCNGKITEKSDVFSFGVILLELITGRRSADANLVEWANPILERRDNYKLFLDPCLGEIFKKKEMKCMIICAAACVRHSPKIRPLMSEVDQILQGKVVI